MLPPSVQEDTFTFLTIYGKSYGTRYYPREYLRCVHMLSINNKTKINTKFYDFDCFDINVNYINRRRIRSARNCFRFSEILD